MFFFFFLLDFFALGGLGTHHGADGQGQRHGAKFSTAATCVEPME